VNLEEFVLADAQRTYCKVCEHPKVREINAAHLAGRPTTAISRWTMKDPDGAPSLGETTLRRHFQNGHNE
jgi:hypothetical protein